jgi:hypothetical protein
MTPFQRINLVLGLAALLLVSGLGLGQTQWRLGVDAAKGPSAYGSR